MSKAQREAFVECAQWLNMPGGAEKEAFHRYPDKPLGNVRECMVQVLKENDCIGLVNTNRKCSCTVTCGLRETWKPCECLCGDCRPGMLVDGKIVGKLSVVAPVSQTGSSKKSVIQTPDE